MIKGKRCWKTIGQIFETLSKILVAASGILSFASGYYKNDTLSFLAGSISTISLAMLQFSSFCFKENKKQSDELNILLKKLGIDTIPVFDRNIDGQGLSRQVQNNDDNFSKIISEIHNIQTQDNNTRNRDDNILQYIDQQSQQLHNNIFVSNDV